MHPSHVFMDGLPLHWLIKKRCSSRVFINDANVFKLVDNRLNVVDIVGHVRGIQIHHDCLATSVSFHLSSAIIGNIVYDKDVLKCGKYFLHVSQNDICLTLFRRRASKISLVPVRFIECIDSNGRDQCFLNTFCPIL